MKKTNLLTIMVMLWAVSLFSQTAPNFTITAADGQTYQLHEDFLQEGKTVLLKIFFTSCPFCISIAPQTEVLYQEWGAGQQDVEFIALSDKSFDDNQDVADFEERFGLTYLGAGSDGGALEALVPYKDGRFGPFFGTPTFVVIAPDGTVNFNIRGNNNPATIQLLDEAIAATGARKPSPPSTYNINGRVVTEAGNPIDGVQITIGGNIASQTTSGNGQFSFEDISETTDVSLQLDKTGNPLAGVSTYDLVLTSKHILGIEPFSSPYRHLAADVNGSGDVTAFDMVDIRKLILGLNSEFADGKVWRFVPECVEFPNPNRPFENVVDTCSPQGLLQRDYNDFDIIGVRLGDVSSRGVIEQGGSQTRQEKETWPLRLESETAPGAYQLRVAVKAGAFRDLIACQFGLKWSPEDWSFKGIEWNTEADAIPIQRDQFNITEEYDMGRLMVAWHDVEAREVKEGTALFYLHFSSMYDSAPTFGSNYPVQLDPSIAPALAYRENGQALDIQLQQSQTSNSMILSLFPNPTSDMLHIRFCLPIPQQTEVSIFDDTGREIKQIYSGMARSFWNQLNFSIKEIPAGQYSIRIRNELGSQIRRLQIIH
ncbi:MAG: redoxin family protein [Bacteroidota bacterium]